MSPVVHTLVCVCCFSWESCARKNTFVAHTLFGVSKVERERTLQGESVCLLPLSLYLAHPKVCTSSVVFSCTRMLSLCCFLSLTLLLSFRLACSLARTLALFLSLAPSRSLLIPLTPSRTLSPARSLTRARARARARFPPLSPTSLLSPSLSFCVCACDKCHNVHTHARANPLSHPPTHPPTHPPA